MPHTADGFILSTPRLAGYCEANSALLPPNNRPAFLGPGLLLPNIRNQRLATLGFPLRPILSRVSWIGLFAGSLFPADKRLRVGTAHGRNEFVIAKTGKLLKSRNKLQFARRPLWDTAF